MICKEEKGRFFVFSKGIFVAFFQIWVCRCVGLQPSGGKGGRSPPLPKRVAGSAEGGLERLGARGSARKLAITRNIRNEKFAKNLLAQNNFLAPTGARQRAAATRKSTNIRSYLLRPTNAAKVAFVRGAACGKAPPTPPPFGDVQGLRPCTPWRTERTPR